MNFTNKLKLVFLPYILIVISFVIGYTYLNWLFIIKLQLFDIKEMLVNFWIPAFLPIIPVYFLLRPRLKLLIIKNRGERDNTFPITVVWVTISIATIIAQLHLESYTGKLTKLDNISQLNNNVKAQTKYYTLKEFSIDKKNIGFSNSFETSGRYNTEFNMTIFVTCPILVHNNYNPIFIDSLSQSEKNPLIVVDGHPVDSAFFNKNFNEKNIESVNVLKNEASQSIYGKAGKYGALIFETKNGYGNLLINSIQNKLPDTIQAWLGITFRNRVSNSLSIEEKETNYKEFALKTEQEFDTMNLNNFFYLENAHHKDEFNNYSEAIDNFMKHTSTKVINYKTVFLPIKEPFENRHGNKFIWIFGAIAIGSIIFLVILFFTKIDTVALSNFENGFNEIEDEDESFFKIFVPSEGFYVTPILIIINVLIFILMVLFGFGFISFKTQELLKIGGNFRPSTLGNHQYWRLLSNIFLHGGIMHVFANMYGLMFVGIFLEPVLGKTRFLFVYICTGILASVSSIWWYEATVSVGASGAIFGLYGVFLALMLTKIFHPEFSKIFLSSTLIFVGFNLLMGFTGGIDNAAHIGGLISGFIIGLILYTSLKKEIQEEEQSLY